jgi:hypothetical protein
MKEATTIIGANAKNTPLLVKKYASPARETPRNFFDFIP